MLLFHQLIRLFLPLLIALDSIVDHHLFWRLHIGTLILLRHPPTVDFLFHWLIYLFRRLLMNYLVLFLVDLTGRPGGSEGSESWVLDNAGLETEGVEGRLKRSGVHSFSGVFGFFLGLPSLGLEPSLAFSLMCAILQEAQLKVCRRGVPST